VVCANTAILQAERFRRNAAASKSGEILVRQDAQPIARRMEQSSKRTYFTGAEGPADSEGLATHDDHSRSALGRAVRRLVQYRDLLITLSVHRLNVRYSVWALLTSRSLHRRSAGDQPQGEREEGMRRTVLLGVVVAAVMVMSTGCSRAEDTSRRSSEAPRDNTVAVGTGGAGSNLRSDDDFVADVAGKNIAEIELSRIALEKASNPDVKFFAQRMVEEHGAAGDNLKSIVSGHPIEWPTQLDEKHRKIADELATKPRADFDREYVKAMIEVHQDLAAKLESRLDVQSVAEWKTAAAGRSESKALPDPTLAMRDVQVRPDKSDSEITRKINQWAADTYPVAQKHLDTARTLENAAKRRPTGTGTS
jgi:putative membrane protein